LVGLTIRKHNATFGDYPRRIHLGPTLLRVADCSSRDAGRAPLTARRCMPITLHRLRKPVRRRRPTQPYFQAHHTRFVSASVRCPYAGKRNRRPHDSIADGALVRVIGSSGHSVISKLNLTSFMGRPNIGHFKQEELTL